MPSCFRPPPAPLRSVENAPGSYIPRVPCVQGEDSQPLSPQPRGETPLPSPGWQHPRPLCSARWCCTRRAQPASSKPAPGGSHVCDSAGQKAAPCTGPRSWLYHPIPVLLGVCTPAPTRKQEKGHVCKHEVSVSSPTLAPSTRTRLFAPCRNFIFASFCCKPRAQGFPCKRGPAALLPTTLLQPAHSPREPAFKTPPAPLKLSPCWEGTSPEQSRAEAGGSSCTRDRSRVGFVNARPRTNPRENVREPRSNQVGQAAVPAAALPPAARAARRRRAAWPR